MHRPKIDNAASSVRSKQNLSCNWTGTADFGRLVPFHWEEMLQTDKVVTIRPKVEMQMLPFASPTFGKINLYLHYFLVPLRLTQKSFYDMWSRTGENMSDTFSYFTPAEMSVMYHEDGPSDVSNRMLFKHWTSLGLNPFFELPAGSLSSSRPIWYAPFAAYNQIWWDFYRDPEVLRDESRSQYLYTDTIYGQAPNQGFAYTHLRPHVRSIKNNWISDLFASVGDSYDSHVFDDSYNYPYLDATERRFNISEDTTAIATNPDEGADATSNTSRIIRLVESLNRLAERLSLSGKRQIEALYARYGVKPKWSEMNMCRYVGGTKVEVMVDDIISTADTSSDASPLGMPLGAKAGAGYAKVADFQLQIPEIDEPCILMGIASVMPNIHYVQGLSKKWYRRDLQDMFQSSLQYVGNVAVAKEEIAYKYRAGQAYDPTQDGSTFAFSDPYYEYKMGLDILAGDFMKYHGVTLPDTDPAYRDLLYMQSMEQYIDFPSNRNFTLNNMLVDGDQFNKIFNYLGGSVDSDVDDHFHLCIDKEVIFDRPMEGFAVPTLETTQDPHKKTTTLSQDKML